MPIVQIPNFGPLVQPAQFDPVGALSQQRQIKSQGILNQSGEMELTRKRALQGLTFGPNGQLTPESAQKFAAADPMGYQKFQQEQADRLTGQKKEGATAFGQAATPLLGKTREEQEAALPGILSSLQAGGYTAPEGVTVDNFTNLVFGNVPTKDQIPKPVEAAKPGTFEDFVTKSFGPNPTAQQLITARKKWETADNVNTGGAGGSKAGTFEAYLAAAYPNATPQQMLQARQEWETASTEGKKAITEKDRIAARATYRNSTSNLTGMEKELDAIRQMPLWKNAGIYGANLPSISGADAAATYSALQGFKSSLANVALQNMREASKTGGAVGQVTEREWGFLAQSIANIDPDKQTVQELYRNLSRAADFIKASRKNMAEKYKDTLGEEPEGYQVPGSGGGSGDKGGKTPKGRTWK